MKSVSQHDSYGRAGVTKISAIIPWVGSFDDVERTLVSVLENRPDECEVIIVHEGPYDDPYDLSGEVRFVEVAAPADPICLANIGTRRAEADIVCLIQAGTTARAGWADNILDHFDDPRVGSVSPAVVKESDPKRLLTAGVRYGAGGARKMVGSGKKLRAVRRCSDVVDGPCHLVGFYRRELLCRLGGLPTDIGEEVTDIDIAMTMLACGYQCRSDVESEFAASSCDGPPWNYDRGVHHERLYMRHGKTLEDRSAGTVCHLMVVAGTVLSSLPKLGALWSVIGRISTAMKRDSVREFHERLGELIESESARLNSVEESVQESDNYRRAA